MREITVSNEQESLELDEKRLVQAIETVLIAAKIPKAKVSLAVVDDPTIHRLNREFLEHDYPTDVLSFLLEREPDYVEGEVIVSVDTAQKSAREYDWPPQDELLLYVVHGTLHLVGYDDSTDEQRAEMRAQEKECLAKIGVEVRWN